MQGRRDHTVLWRYLRSRYPYVFEKGAAKPRKSGPIFREEYIRKYIDEINLLHRFVCSGDLTQVEKLENYNADEYYSTVNTFLREHEQKESKEDRKVKS